MIWIRRVGDHLEEASPQLQLPVVDASGDAVKVGEERFHPSPVPRLYPGLTHPEDLLHAGKLRTELCDARLAHPVVAEDEQGRQNTVVTSLGWITQLLIEEGHGQGSMLVLLLQGGVVGVGGLRSHGMGCSAHTRGPRRPAVDMEGEFWLQGLLPPVVLPQRLFPLHAEVASGQGTDGVLETLAGRCEAEDMFSVRIARAVDDDHRGTDDLLIVVEEEGDAGEDLGAWGRHGVLMIMIRV